MLCLLSGCATCDRHPKACDAAFVVGSALLIGGLSIRDSHQKTGCTCGCPGTPRC